MITVSCLKWRATERLLKLQTNYNEANTALSSTQSDTELACEQPEITWQTVVRNSKNGVAEDIWEGCYPQTEAKRKQWMAKTPANEDAHPAKMGWVLAGRIHYGGVRRGWWQEGSRVGSPMAGEGTELLVFRLGGCEVFGIEIEERMYRRLKKNMDHMTTRFAGEPPLFSPPLLDDHVWCGDSTKPWPEEMDRLDAVVFSPTYDSAIRKGSEGPGAKAIKGETLAERRAQRKIIVGYGSAPGQVGNLTGQAWRDAMQSIYRNSYEATNPGGILVTVTKDIRKKWQIYPIADMTIEDATAVGWIGPIARFRAVGACRSWAAQYNNQRYVDAGRPDLVLDHEDILIFSRGRITVDRN